MSTNAAGRRVGAPVGAPSEAKSAAVRRDHGPGLPTGELVLVWSLGGDGLALVANEKEFGEAALIALAESAVIQQP